MVTKKTKNLIQKTLLYLVLIFFTIVTCGPFLWLFSTSLMPGENIFTFPPKLIPSHIDFKNYIEVWQFLSIPKYLMNTIIITGFGVFLNIFFSTLTAYPLATYRFKGRDTIFYILIGTMIIPAAAGMIVNYLTILNMGLLNTYMGVVLPSAVTVMNVFLMRQAYLSVPMDIRESGRIDGAGEFRIWLQLILPMVKPTIAVIGLFQFMGFWNDFLWPIIIFDDSSKYPLSAALTLLNGQFSYNFGWIAAGTTLSVIPIILIFIICQNQFIDGMSGALKG
ncbi:MAG: carbohydrate ABC transporter permease [Cellulosilyticaceae bacterium]